MSVSCQYCGHWNAGFSERYGTERAKAYCTFNPVWVETAQQHFCAQYVNHNDDRVPAVIANRQRQANESAVFGRKQHERALKAEKTLKELRAKLRGKP